MTSDPIIPPFRTSSALSNFHERIYDLSPETHLARLLKVLIGEPGVGQLQKKYTYAHLSQVISAIQYYDLDRFYADVFGIRRLISEQLIFDPYDGSGDSDQWEQIAAADSNYRNRVALFSRAVVWAGTPAGMAMAASALLNCEVRVYETYTFLDDADSYVGTGGSMPVDRTYGDVENLGTYGDLHSYSYGQIETTSPFRGRSDGSRGEFIIRPLKAISGEDRLNLIRSISRIKPAEALMTIDLTGAAIAKPVTVQQATADSEYWHIRSKVSVREENADIYTRYDATQAIEQPRPISGFYQGEAWNYNGDVNTIMSYSIGSSTTTTNSNYLMETNPQDSTLVARLASDALASPVEIMQGRVVSDGVISSSTVLEPRNAGVSP